MTTSPYRPARGWSRESGAARRRRAAEVVRRLEEAFPEVECALIHANPFELLVATVLSAQCTDKKVNEATPALFARWPTPGELALAPAGELEAVIHSLGFFNQKAKSLRGLSALLVRDHGGEVPASMDALLRLPGVARKTANVVLGTAFGIAVGVVVDTHVQRIAGKLLRLSKHQDPKKIEKDLMALLPPTAWIDFSHRVIWHGRGVCVARRPACDRCTMVDLCPGAFPTR